MHPCAGLFCFMGANDMQTHIMYRRDYFPALVWCPWIKDCQIIKADPELIEIELTLDQFQTLKG